MRLPWPLKSYIQTAKTIDGSTCGVANTIRVAGRAGRVHGASATGYSQQSNDPMRQTNRLQGLAVALLLGLLIGSWKVRNEEPSTQPTPDSIRWQQHRGGSGECRRVEAPH